MDNKKLMQVSFGCFDGGMWLLSGKKNKRLNLDYSKLLGSDNQYKFDIAGIYISNHTNTLDTALFAFLMKPFVSMVGKREVRRFTLVGSLCDPLMQLLVDREHRASKESRGQVLEQIKER